MNFANFSSGTKCKGSGLSQSERSSNSFSLPFPSPLSGDSHHHLDALDGCFFPAAQPQCVGKRSGELSLLGTSVVLTLQTEEGPAALFYRITLDHCYSLGSSCQCGQNSSRCGRLYLRGWASVYLTHVRLLRSSSCLRVNSFNLKNVFIC